MPQMSPMMWTQIMILMTIMLMMIKTKTYFEQKKK
nr:ATP synthase F0 subunit 8 [Oecleopsis sinicus]UVV36477.1 ATP synthase F0 subunit 8 [Oecleopsis sinicus]WOW98999.1 ATP synthase F0 subunit 8 [Oecleopsis sp.]